uniref:Uncharacterized protein n=1 Tax=Psilocybe cubensis TaxID=181762 RepID=A0A8H8CEG0_PSICU
MKPVNGDGEEESAGAEEEEDTDADESEDVEDAEDGVEDMEDEEDNGAVGVGEEDELESVAEDDDPPVITEPVIGMGVVISVDEVAPAVLDSGVVEEDPPAI